MENGIGVIWSRHLQDGRRVKTRAALADAGLYQESIPVPLLDRVAVVGLWDV